MFKIEDWRGLQAGWGLEIYNAHIVELQLTQDDRTTLVFSLASEQMHAATSVTELLEQGFFLFNDQGQKVPILTSYAKESTFTLERPFLWNKPLREVYPLSCKTRDAWEQDKSETLQRIMGT